jgi:hypothetical protein
VAVRAQWTCRVIAGFHAHRSIGSRVGRFGAMLDAAGEAGQGTYPGLVGFVAGGALRGFARFSFSGMASFAWAGDFRSVRSPWMV